MRRTSQAAAVTRQLAPGVERAHRVDEANPADAWFGRPNVVSRQIAAA
jgi:hypothetical protein